MGSTEPFDPWTYERLRELEDGPDRLKARLAKDLRGCFSVLCEIAQMAAPIGSSPSTIVKNYSASRLIAMDILLEKGGPDAARVATIDDLVAQAERGLASNPSWKGRV